MLSTRLSAIRLKITSIPSSLSEKLTIPEKYKGTFIEKWAKYWKTVANDYTDSAGNFIKESREKPLKSTIYGVSGLFVYLCAKMNPDEESFTENVRKYSNELILVDASCHRKESADYLKMLQDSSNQGIVRYQSLGICSIIWIAEYDKDVNVYKAMCSYTQPNYLTFYERIVDVGFWNRWWMTEKKMQDFDINY